MPRIRNIKPEFFDDPDIGDLSLQARLLFIGLCVQADREGRLIDDPRRLKIRLLPFDDVDVDGLLSELSGKAMIVRYQDSVGTNLIWVRQFSKHQRPHMKENASVLEPFTINRKEVSAGPIKVVSSPPDPGVLDPGILDPGVLRLDAGNASLRSDAAAAYLDINDLASAWNSHTTAPIPRCRELSPARRKQITARLKERPISSWREVFTRINDSPFCRGETERGQWKASFDWIIGNADNAIKVLEGKYDRQTTPSQDAEVLRRFVARGENT